MTQPFDPPPELTSPEFQAMLQQCIHCGLCLQACPTYSVFGSETDSPRGRISLMRAASEGRIELKGPFREHIDLCLECRNCETACPSGVQYGALYDQTRVALERADPPGGLERFLRWVALKQLLPRTGRLHAMARLLRLYQASGLSRFVRGLGLLPGPLKVMEGMLPPLETRYMDYRRPAPAMGEKRGVVAFFYGCVQEAFLQGANQAAVRVLQRNGYEVRFPANQTCCGAAALHVGEKGQAVRQARQNIDAFLQAGAEEWVAIINHAGGCGTELKAYGHLLENDPDYAEKARRFSARVMDINEFLAGRLHRPPTGQVRRRVTYQDSCSLRNGQKIVSQPRQLLRSIPGLELVEMERPDRCCGSAGVYNILQWETADSVLEEKMADIDRTGADTIAVSNSGCHMQLVYGAQRLKRRPQVMHVVELLEESYQAEETGGAA